MVFFEVIKRILKENQLFVSNKRTEGKTNISDYLLKKLDLRKLYIGSGIKI